LDSAPPDANARKEERHAGVQITLAVLLATYFLCPYLYLLPFLIAARTGAIPFSSLQRVGVLFRPVEWLSLKVPAYEDLLSAEARLMPESLFPPHP
jgi:hypothetical protein